MRLRHARGGIEFGGMALAVAHAQRMAGVALLARDGQDDGGIHAAGEEDDCILHGMVIVRHHARSARDAGRVRRVQRSAPGSSFHSSLCNCIWKRTGTCSATIQSASSRGASWAWLGENSTSQRSVSRCSATMPRAQSKSARSQITNLTWSRAVSSGMFSQRLRATSREPGVLMSSTRETRGSTSEIRSRRKFPATRRNRHRTAAAAA